MTRAQRAHGYLRQSMIAGNPELGAEHREAARLVMANHEREYPGVREHALVGSDRDFPHALSPSERRQQAELQERAGLTHGQVLEARKRLREGDEESRPGGGPAPSRTRRRSGLGQGTRLAPAARSAGHMGTYLLGLMLGMALLYLVLSKKGSKAFSSVLTGITKLVHGFIAPIDPLGEGSVFSQLVLGKEPAPKPGPRKEAPRGRTPAYEKPLSGYENFTPLDRGPAPSPPAGVSGATNAGGAK